MTKKRTARDVTIRLGDLFDDKTIPDDLDKAIASTLNMDRLLANKDREWTDRRLRDLADAVLSQAHAALLNELLYQRRILLRGAGPKLPPRVTFAKLMPHLREARRILASEDIRFEDWLEAHDWPEGMKPKNTTVRTWLTRYSKVIDDYEKGMSHYG